jgi:hypothetical protein
VASEDPSLVEDGCAFVPVSLAVAVAVEVTPSLSNNARMHVVPVGSIVALKNEAKESWPPE